MMKKILTTMALVAVALTGSLSVIASEANAATVGVPGYSTGLPFFEEKKPVRSPAAKAGTRKEITCYDNPVAATGQWAKIANGAGAVEISRELIPSTGEVLFTGKLKIRHGNQVDCNGAFLGSKVSYVQTWAKQKGYTKKVSVNQVNGKIIILEMWTSPKPAATPTPAPKPPKTPQPPKPTKPWVESDCSKEAPVGAYGMWKNFVRGESGVEVLQMNGQKEIIAKIRVRKTDNKLYCTKKIKANTLADARKWIQQNGFTKRIAVNYENKSLRIIEMWRKQGRF